MWKVRQTVWRKRRIIDSFYQRLSPEKLRSHSDMPTMSLQIFQFSKFTSACIFATFKFFQSYAEIYMVSIFLRNLCQIVSGEANIFLPLSLIRNPRLGFLWSSYFLCLPFFIVSWIFINVISPSLICLSIISRLNLKSNRYDQKEMISRISGVPWSTTG